MRPLLLALALPLALVARARADAPPRDPGALRHQVHERVQSMLIWKLTEALSLDEASAQRFFPVLHRYEERLQPIRQRQGERFRQLRTELDSGHPDAGRLNTLIDELAAGRAQVVALEAERAREVRKVLTPVQAAKLVLAMPKIEHELRKQVRRAMSGDDED